MRRDELFAGMRRCAVGDFVALSVVDTIFSDCGGVLKHRVCGHERDGRGMPGPTSGTILTGPKLLQTESALQRAQLLCDGVDAMGRCA